MAATKRDRKYMELAVKEMRESRSEHAHKHDPLVGAVLVGSDGQVLGRAHRGALRVGHHAEFTLIERCLQDKNLEGSMLYDPRMRDLLVSHGLPPPQFSFDSGYFVVTFLGEETGVGRLWIAPELLAQLDERQKKIVNFVRESGRITRTECTKQFKVSPKTATRDLNKLVELGLLEPRGKGPATHYILIGS